MSSVLLVDDTGLFDAVADDIARRTHCRPLRASNGTEALATARREKPDLIFLDAQMSGMTGIDVCRVLKADSHLGHRPVVVAAATDVSAEAARRAGADACIEKPFDTPVVFDIMRRYLQLSPRDAARAAVEWSVTFWRDGAQHEGTLRDLSRGGFFIRTPVRQPVGARLEISFDLPGQKGRTVVAEAIVVRVGQDADRGLGCRFFRLTAGSRAHLEECLRLLEAGVPVGRI
ncbi:MAG: response regulator [Acidobacteria bacterium]|nr:response regulator [Acidobacteriota bacterium]MCA1610964.1 response regulator [Acidobacteriota bacterium]